MPGGVTHALRASLRDFLGRELQKLSGHSAGLPDYLVVGTPWILCGIRGGDCVGTRGGALWDSLRNSLQLGDLRQSPRRLRGKSHRLDAWSCHPRMWSAPNPPNPPSPPKPPKPPQTLQVPQAPQNPKPPKPSEPSEPQIPNPQPSTPRTEARNAPHLCSPGAPNVWSECRVQWGVSGSMGDCNQLRPNSACPIKNGGLLKSLACIRRVSRSKGGMNQHDRMVRGV